MAKKEKIIFSQKCDKCRCKNSMTEDDILFRMRFCNGDKYVFWCNGCTKDIFVNKKQLPKTVQKKVEKRFRG